MRRPRPLYYFLKRYAYVTSHLFYRKFTISGLENVPDKGPVIFVPNHQNAFMDAVVIAVTSKRKPWFLTRASIFVTATARYWLSSLRMIPIYRFRDGLQNVKRNDQTMEIVLDLLKKNETILIFAEGNHDRKWSLRPLQKGLARISFAHESARKTNPGLTIIPVGLQYEDHMRFRSDLLLTYGKPIYAADFMPQYQVDPIHATNSLLEEVRKGLSSLIIDIQDLEHYEPIKKAIVNRPHREEDLGARLKGDQEVVSSGNFSSHQPHQPKAGKLFTIFGFPFFLYGAINHLLIYWGIKLILSKYIKDDHWTASIKFAGMIILSPLIYTLQSLILWHYFPDWVCLIAYVLSLPISGVIAGNYRARVLLHRK
ncbi:MAG: 1-acyl-sn-glycerol-3-phosphate acyltransferase [Bacteroidales bacterium]